MPIQVVGSKYVWNKSLPANQFYGKFIDFYQCGSGAISIIWNLVLCEGRILYIVSPFLISIMNLPANLTINFQYTIGFT